MKQKEAKQPWYKTPSGNLDARLFSTPLGAVAGIVLARKLIPKEDRNLFNQGAGGAAGAGLGYMAGGYINDHMDTPELGDREGWKRKHQNEFFDRGPAYDSEASAAELEQFDKAMPIQMKSLDPTNPSHKRVAQSIAEFARKFHDASAKSVWARDKAQSLQESDPAAAAAWTKNADMWGKRANHYRSYVGDSATKLDIGVQGVRQWLNDKFRALNTPTPGLNN